MARVTPHIGCDLFKTDGVVYLKNEDNIHFGGDVFIGHGTFIDGYHEGDGIEIGNNTWIGQGCYIHAAGGVYVSDHVGIGPCSKIFSSVHSLSPHSVITRNPVVMASVHVSRGVDIGIGSIIMPGVTVGEDAQIGAGSVVAHHVDPCTVVAGNPAKFIRRRTHEVQ